MAMMNGLVFDNYVNGVRIAASYAKPLARGLANALPKDADAKEKAAIKHISVCANAIDETLNERDDVIVVREPYLAHANSWGALFDVLLGKMRIPAKHSDIGARAQTILDTVGDEREVFMRLDAPAAWSEGDRRYRRLVERGLEAETNAVAGPEHLIVIKKSSAELADVIGLGKTPREIPSTTGLAEGLYALSKAVAKYCRVLSAKVDEDDLESVARFRKAVAPIDTYRSRTSRDGGDAVDATDTEATDGTEFEVAPTPTPNPAPTPAPVAGPTPVPPETDPTNVD